MKLLFFLFTFSALTMSDHNIQVAVFRIYQDSNSLMLSVDIDSDDLAKDMDLSTDDFSTRSVENYLNNKLSLFFDDTKSMVKVDKIVQNDDHTEIVSTLTINTNDYQTLDIHNHCLMSNEGQSNIVELRLPNQERDFLMHIERTKIQIEL